MPLGCVQIVPVRQSTYTWHIDQLKQEARARSQQHFWCTVVMFSHEGRAHLGIAGNARWLEVSHIDIYVLFWYGFRIENTQTF